MATLDWDRAGDDGYTFVPHGEDHGPANPHADRAGLARMVGNQWLVYERVLASEEPGRPRHVALEGFPKTVCSRKVTFRYGPTPTDTLSDIECLQCRAYIAEHTL